MKDRKASQDEIARFFGFYDWPDYLSWWHEYFYNVKMPGPDKFDPYKMIHLGQEKGTK